MRYALDTHVHADHVTASGAVRERTGAQVVASKLGAPCSDFKVSHGDTLELGALKIEVLATPGHTDDSVTFRIGDNLFTGDALFVRGNGRTDFQNGDADELYHTITEVLFPLGDHLTIWPGHDYKGLTRSTIGEERLHNPRVAGRSREQFAEIMHNLGLPPPRLLDVAVPANQACGKTETRPNN